MLKRVRAAGKRLLPEVVLQRLLPRSFQVLCIGTPKSGTTSVAEIFRPTLRVAHEPDRRRLVTQMYRHFRGGRTDDDYVGFLRRRGRELRLDLESNCFLGYRPDLVASAFPDASFVLTIREPLSWLRSMLNNHLDYPPRVGSVMEKWHEVFFQLESLEYQESERVLKERGLYPVRTYLRYWVSHNRGVIEALRARRLCLMGTTRLTTEIPRLCSFVGVEAGGLAPQKTRWNRTAMRHGVFDGLDPEWLRSEVEKVCSKLVAQYELAELFGAGTESGLR